jgi:hypothetical protein
VSDEQQLDRAELDPALERCMGCFGHPPIPCQVPKLTPYSCVNQVPMMGQAPERQQAFRDQFAILAHAAVVKGERPRQVMITTVPES